MSELISKTNRASEQNESELKKSRNRRFTRTKQKHAANASRIHPLHGLSRKINKYILIPPNSILVFPPAKPAPRHMAEENQTYYLKSNQQTPLVNNTGTKRAK